MGVQVIITNNMKENKILSFRCYDSKGLDVSFGVINKGESKSKLMFLSSGQILKCSLQITGVETKNNDMLVIGYYYEGISKVLISIVKEKKL